MTKTKAKLKIRRVSLIHKQRHPYSLPCSASSPVHAKYRKLHALQKRVDVRPGTAGQGLFLEEPVNAREIVIEYVGEKLTKSQVKRRERYYKRKGIQNQYMVDIGHDCGLVIDAGGFGNAARYINHCCEPNCELVHEEIEKTFHTVFVYALKDIEKGLEVTVRYNWEKNKNGFGSTCKCVVCEKKRQKKAKVTPSKQGEREDKNDSASQSDTETSVDEEK